MNVLIRGMEMPKSCRTCMISQPDGCGWICPIIESKPIVDGRVNSRHPHCPLDPVPPHGRLIDADAEVEVWDVCGRQGVFPHFTTTVSKFLLGHLVGKIPPTIIPTEEAEE